MEKVRKEQLIGFRNPTTEESRRIQKRVIPELHQKYKRTGRLLVFLGCVFGDLVISILGKLLRKDFLIGEMAVVGIIAIFVLWGLFPCAT